MINKDRGRGQDLCLRFFEKVWSLTPFDWMLGIRMVSGIRPTCLCRCPPLPIIHRLTFVSYTAGFFYTFACLLHGGVAQLGCGAPQLGCGVAHLGCGMPQAGCGVAHLGCGVAQLITRWSAIRQSRVRFPCPAPPSLRKTSSGSPAQMICSAPKEKWGWIL